MDAQNWHSFPSKTLNKLSGLGSFRIDHNVKSNFQEERVLSNIRSWCRRRLSEILQVCPNFSEKIMLNWIMGENWECLELAIMVIHIFQKKTHQEVTQMNIENDSFRFLNVFIFSFIAVEITKEKIPGTFRIDNSVNTLFQKENAVGSITNWYRSRFSQIPETFPFCFISCGNESREKNRIVQNWP